MVDFEIRIPILPTDGFYSNVKLAVKSLRNLGGSYETVPIHVSVGGMPKDPTPELTKEINAWSKDDPNLHWRIIPPQVRTTEFASVIDRIANPLEKDVVIMCDADLCITKDIQPLLEIVAAQDRPTLAGMMAHQSPFSKDPDENREWWQKAFALFDVPMPEFDYNHTLAPASQGKSPMYINQGFTVMNRSAFEILGKRMAQITLDLARMLRPGNKHIFALQVALTVAIEMERVQFLQLGPQYNCTNEDAMLRCGLSSPEDVRVLHYQRRDVFDRHKFLCEQEAFLDFSLAEYDSAILQMFQKHVLSLEDVFFERGAAA
ncbi:hypothetical protein [Shimia marina]|uniref:Glycosyl transferase family 2 n=1 Tax=Shimia marina TaxID=321267 RepID=A0A0P1EJM9_9RHOB|nr:hypothetical protein [Shimia marina]CUH50737.1 hypothetical protein SHM7688_00166 [Shimia marina]SFE35445.1 hypothetical protein SAMN04488037_10827 [Shimia marina]